MMVMNLLSYSKKKTEIMAKEAYYFSHDSNSRNDPKIVKLRMKLGWAGYGIFWAIVEMLRDEDGYAMQTEYESIAFALNEQCDTIKSIIEDFGLFKITSNNFHSESLKKRMQLKDEKSNKASKAAKIRWDKEKDADAMQTHSESNAIVMQGKERKGKEIKENITIRDLEIIEKSRLGGKNYKDGLKDLYELNEYQFNLGLNEWKLMNEVTEFKDEGHLKRSLNLHMKNNSQVLKAHKQERSSVSKIQNNQW